MSRPKKVMPEYQYHISGQARVYLDGKYYYLGEHDSPESRSRYFALLKQYSDNGQRMPKETPTHQVEAPITVRCVTGEWRSTLSFRYRRSPGHMRRHENLCTLLEDEYGDLPASDFGPRKLAELRDLFVVSGNNRNYANTQVNSIRMMFEHAVSRELIGVDVHQRLKTLRNLRKGETLAPEGKKRQPVSLDLVKATLRYMSPTLKAMVTIQAATGMRGKELFEIRPVDIDRRGEVWLYRLDHHKTENHIEGDAQKVVPIVGPAREALTPFLFRDDSAFCFSPAESATWYREKRTSNRKTPARYGNRVGTNRKANPKRSPRSKYEKDSYRASIERACKRGKLTKWSPSSLRNTAADAINEALGIEFAQALLGHQSDTMTRHYARQSEARLKARRAIEAAKVAPAVG